jgi:hypothetical protein
MAQVECQVRFWMDFSLNLTFRRFPILCKPCIFSVANGEKGKVTLGKVVDYSSFVTQRR